MTYKPKEREILDQVVAALHGHYGERLSRVVLFGSRARRDHAPDSDYDVLVVLKDALDGRTERATLHKLIYPIDWENDTVVFCLAVEEERFERENSPLMLNVRKEGVGAMTPEHQSLILPAHDSIRAAKMQTGDPRNTVTPKEAAETNTDAELFVAAIETYLKAQP